MHDDDNRVAKRKAQLLKAKQVVDERTAETRKDSLYTLPVNNNKNKRSLDSAALCLRLVFTSLRQQNLVNLLTNKNRLNPTLVQT